MLASLRLPWRTAQPCPVTCRRRNIAFTVARQAKVAAETQAVKPADGPEAKQGGEEESEGRFESNSAQMLETFLQTVGAQFKIPQKPNNWLGGNRVGLCLTFCYLIAYKALDHSHFL